MMSPVLRIATARFRSEIRGSGHPLTGHRPGRASVQQIRSKNVLVSALTVPSKIGTPKM